MDKDLAATLQSMEVDFSSKAELTPELLSSRRQRILDLEKMIMGVEGAYGMAEFNEGNVKHHFGTGVYGRELFIPAGNVIVSKIHKNKTFNVIAQGTISVIDPETGFKTFTAPHVFVSSPMTKRLVIAHEDTLWITSHANENNSEDLEEIEEKTIAKNFNLIEGKE